jgi:hypothetical protein
MQNNGNAVNSFGNNFTGSDEKTNPDAIKTAPQRIIA